MTFLEISSAFWLLAMLSGSVIVLCIKNYHAVIIAFCIGGVPLTALLKTVYGYSATKTFIVIIALEVVLLVFDKEAVVRFRKSKRFLQYCLWVGLIYVLLLVTYTVSAKTAYAVYYMQFFSVYVTASCLAGLLAVQRALKIEEVLLPMMVFFACSYPTFNSTVTHMSPVVLESEVGARVLEGIGGIKLGRLAGALTVLAFCILWERSSHKGQKLVMLESALAFSICLPMLWFAQTRQSIIAAFVTIETQLLFLVVLRKGRSVRRLLLGCVAAILIIWASWTFLEWAGEHLAQVRVHRIADFQRFHRWKSVWEGICEKPVTGHGLGGYYSQHGIWPHNWILEAWHDYGVIGLLLLCVPIITILSKSYLAPRGHFSWAILGSYWVIVAQASGDIPRNSTVFFFFTVVFFRAIMEQKNAKVGSSEKNVRRYEGSRVDVRDCGRRAFEKMSRRRAVRSDEVA